MVCVQPAPYQSLRTGTPVSGVIILMIDLHYKLQFTISNGSINLLLEVKEVCFTHNNNFL